MLNFLLSAVAQFIFCISFVLFIFSIHTLRFNAIRRKRCFSWNTNLPSSKPKTQNLKSMPLKPIYWHLMFYIFSHITCALCIFTSFNFRLKNPPSTQWWTALIRKLKELHRNENSTRKLSLVARLGNKPFRTSLSHVCSCLLIKLIG